MNTRKMHKKLGAKVGVFYLNVQLKPTRGARFGAFLNGLVFL